MRIVIASFLGLFFLIGMGILGYSIRALLRSRQAEQWPSTPGVVESCELQETEGEDTTNYKVAVRYRYQVADQQFTNDVLAFGYHSSNTPDSHQQILKKLRASRAVEVRYSPDDPQNAVISYGFHRSLQTALAFGITWLAMVSGFGAIFWLSGHVDHVLLRNLITQ